MLFSPGMCTRWTWRCSSCQAAFGKEISGGCGSGWWRRQKEEGCGCDLSRTDSRWLGLRPKEEMSSREQEGTVSWSAEESSLNAADLRVTQEEDNLSPFSINVYVVDMILSELSWSRSFHVCVPLPVWIMLLETGNWGIVSVMFCLSKGQFRLQNKTMLSSFPMGCQCAV